MPANGPGDDNFGVRNINAPFVMRDGRRLDAIRGARFCGLNRLSLGSRIWERRRFGGVGRSRFAIARFRELGFFKLVKFFLAGLFFAGARGSAIKIKGGGNGSGFSAFWGFADGSAVVWRRRR